MSFYYINILMTAFLMISDHFPKIYDDFPKIFPKARPMFLNIFGEIPKIPEDVRRLLKTAKDFRGGPEDVSMIHQ